MKRNCLLLGLFSILNTLYSCNSFKYYGDQVSGVRKISDCEIEVFFLKPTFQFKKLGECLGKGFSINGDGSRPAIRQLEKCACKYGGDAVVITKASDRELDTHNTDGYILSSSDFGVKFIATVIKRE